MDAVAKQAEQVRPKLIIAGGSAYSRASDLARFREIADRSAPISWWIWRISRLVAGGAYPARSRMPMS